MKRDAADKRWSRAVRNRDDCTCRRCGKPYPPNAFGLHAAHIFSRGIKRTRCDVDNGISLCWGCHAWFDNLDKADKEAWARAQIGDDVYDALKERARNPRKRQPVGAT